VDAELQQLQARADAVASASGIRVRPPGRTATLLPVPSARAYLRDLPDAELHLFDTGHFALEDRLPKIALLIADF
jgi:hypothetical protein